MADCELLAGCLFFNDKMKGTEGLGGLYKQGFCLGDNSKCARYMVCKKLGRDAVPADLWPNMYKRANEMLSGE
jgi:hypothetical protein